MDGSVSTLSFDSAALASCVVGEMGQTAGSNRQSCVVYVDQNRRDRRNMVCTLGVHLLRVQPTPGARVTPSTLAHLSFVLRGKSLGPRLPSVPGDTP